MSDIAFVFGVVCGELDKLGVAVNSLEEFARLVELVTCKLRENTDMDAISRPRIQVLTAMAIQGGCVKLPGETMCEQLEGLAVEYCKQEKGRQEGLDARSVLDLAAAFGCGWNRDLKRNPGWDGLWTGSFTYLVRSVEKIARSVYQSLHADGAKGRRFKIRNLHVQFPQDDPVEPLLETATFISAALVQPTTQKPAVTYLRIAAGARDGDPVLAGLTVTTDADWEEDIPPGGRAVYRCTDGKAHDNDRDRGFGAEDVIRLLSSDTRSEVNIWTDGKNRSQTRLIAAQEQNFTGNAKLELWACTCSSPDCELRHRITSWAPWNDYQTLQNFLYHALRGKMQSITAKEFAVSLLGSYWARQGWGNGARIRLARVAHRVCSSLKCVQLDDAPGVRVHMGAQCDRCGVTVTDETPVVLRDRLIVVNTIQPMWAIKEFWGCNRNGCHPSGLPEKNNHTLFEASIGSVMHKFAECGHCSEEFWSRDEALTILENARKRDENGATIPAKTLRECVRRLDRIRMKRVCQACGQPAVAIVYCAVCQDATSGLKRDPTWLFEWTGMHRQHLDDQEI